MSQTQAVETAVLERLAALDRKAAEESAIADTKRETAGALLKRIRDGLTDEDRSELQSAEAELFDQHGLPR